MPTKTHYIKIKIYAKGMKYGHLSSRDHYNFLLHMNKLVDKLKKNNVTLKFVKVHYMNRIVFKLIDPTGINLTELKSSIRDISRYLISDTKITVTIYDSMSDLYEDINI